jgi:hypothetical protein
MKDAIKDMDISIEDKALEYIIYKKYQKRN